MSNRDNIIGFLLLGLCAAVAGVLIYSIATGQRFRFTGPDWLGGALGIVFVVAIIYSLVTTFRKRWPNPMTGQGWRWPWSRDKKDDSGPTIR